MWSATSFSEAARDARETQRWNRLHPGDEPRVSASRTLPRRATTPVIVAPATTSARGRSLIAEYVTAPLTTLGTDGFGRSDTRARLRSFFEVDRHQIVLAALTALAAQGHVDRARCAAAIARTTARRRSGPRPGPRESAGGVSAPGGFVQRRRRLPSSGETAGRSSIGAADRSEFGDDPAAPVGSVPIAGSELERQADHDRVVVGRAVRRRRVVVRRAGRAGRLLVLEVVVEDRRLVGVDVPLRRARDAERESSACVSAWSSRPDAPSNPYEYPNVLYRPISST